MLGKSPNGIAALLQTLSTNEIERPAQIETLVAGMSNAERVEALDTLWNDSATPVEREFARSLLRKWAEEMPQAAAEWLSRKPPGALQQAGSRSVAIVWANQSLTEAANWVRGWPAEEKEAGLLAVAYEAARSSPRPNRFCHAVCGAEKIRPRTRGVR